MTNSTDLGGPETGQEEGPQAYYDDESRNPPAEYLQLYQKIGLGALSAAHLQIYNHQQV